MCSTRFRNGVVSPPQPLRDATRQSSALGVDSRMREEHPPSSNLQRATCEELALATCRPAGRAALAECPALQCGAPANLHTTRPMWRRLVVTSWAICCRCTMAATDTRRRGASQGSSPEAEGPGMRSRRRNTQHRRSMHWGGRNAAMEGRSTQRHISADCRKSAMLVLPQKLSIMWPTSGQLGLTSPTLIKPGQAPTSRPQVGNAQANFGRPWHIHWADSASSG